MIQTPNFESRLNRGQHTSCAADAATGRGDAAVGLPAARLAVPPELSCQNNYNWAARQRSYNGGGFSTVP